NLDYQFTVDHHYSVYIYNEAYDIHHHASHLENVGHGHVDETNENDDDDGKIHQISLRNTHNNTIRSDDRHDLEQTMEDVMGEVNYDDLEYELHLPPIHFS